MKLLVVTYAFVAGTLAFFLTGDYINTGDWYYLGAAVVLLGMIMVLSLVMLIYWRIKD